MPQDSNPSTNKSLESNHIFHSTTVMGEKMFRGNVVNNRTIKRKHHRRFGLEKCFLLPRYLQINVINCCRLSGSEITLKMRVIPMEFHSFAKPFRWKCLPIDYVNRKRHTFDVKFYLSLFSRALWTSRELWRFNLKCVVMLKVEINLKLRRSTKLELDVEIY